MDQKTIPIQRISIELKESEVEPHRDWDKSISYRALFEQTGECIFIISLDFRYITANQQALNLLGYEEELIDKPVDEVLSQDTALNNEIFSDVNSHIQERVLKCKDGSRIPVEISTSIVYDANGEPAYIQSIARDISARKKQEQTLKRNAQILSIISEGTARLLKSSEIDTKIPSLLEALGQAMSVACCAIFSLDTFSGEHNVRVNYLWNSTAYPDLDISTIVNPSLHQLLDSKEQVYFSERWESVNSPEPALSFVSIPINGTIGGKSYLGFFDHAGTLAWSQVEIAALQTAANLISAALQRKRYEETIRLSEVRNRILIESLPDLIIRVDTQGNILDYSASPNHPLYIHRDLAYGRKLDKTFPEEIASRIIGTENRETFFTPQVVEEFRLPYANGTYEAKLYPIYADEALIVIRDVTEQVKLNEMKSDFINRASHELRTPLTAAMLMVELIQEGGTPEEMEDCWRTLKGELHRQKELIDRLLMAGRLESGMLKIEGKAIDLLPILRESMQSVQPIIAKRHISLKLSNDHQSYLVWGDTSALQQVFINLINNAAKFSPEKSTVEIEITQSETHTNIAIIDKGVGIPQESIPHLFKRFYRAKNVTAAEIPGSGIGLYIVHSIISELGGEILVKSVPNQGTTFTVCLKRAGACPSRS
jgi:PAS domain S-box-containing protein